MNKKESFVSLKAKICLIIIIVIAILIFFKEAHALTFKEYINQPVKTETKEGLRLDWETVFGYDIFKPYFEIHEFQKKLLEKTTVNFKTFKGRLSIKDDYSYFEYRFTHKF